MPTWAGNGFVDTGRTIFKTMVGTASAVHDAVFDSELTVAPGPGMNHMLALKLKMYLNKFQPPMNPFTHEYFSTWIYADFSSRIFIIGPWSQAEWSRFVKRFLTQCDMWNNKFWLIPPADFTALDVTTGGKKVRPNVYCNLNVQVQYSPAGAHRSITVVNMDAKSAARQGGKKETDVTSLDFRSDDSTYDSMDTAVGNVGLRDPSGNPQSKVRFYTIPHEIGHAIGQPHIGVIRKEPLCQMAILLDRLPGVNKSALPALFAGASNSLACYGDFASVPTSSNVMGGGDQFAVENAQPWRDALLRHTKARTAWTVSMSRVAPSPVK
ncbi:MAG TPA: hypothetical protein VKU19_27215 [Bryobacteraceae bacterium]|nr:hypothetical protein [Bryobacteraceae bacterium]